MKKVIWGFILLLISINVNASNEVSFSVECSKTNLSKGESTNCTLSANISPTIAVDTVNLDFYKDIDLEIEFTPFKDWSGNIQNNRLVLGSSKEQSGNIVLGSLSVKVIENASYGNKNISFKNISFSNTNNIVGLYKTSDVIVKLNVLSDDNDLEYIRVNGILVPGFDSDKTSYDNVSVTADTIIITASAVDSRALVEGIGEKKVDYGENEFKIKVTSESGIVKVYTLIIKRMDNRSTDNSLKKLIIKGYNFAFDKKKTTYKLNVESNVTKIIIESQLNDDKASYVDNYGNREVSLDYGENNIEIKVKSEKGEIKTYTIIINREDDRSDVAKLTSLIINDQTIELKNNVYEYDVSLRYKNTKTNIIATANDKARIEYKDINLKVGNNPLIIKVISEKNTIQEYKINIKRLSETNSKVYLENIMIKDYELNFSRAIIEYNLKIKKDDEALEFIILPDEDELTYTIIGNNNLKNGSIINVQIKDDDGTYNYKINIIKDVDKELILGILTIEQICYIVFIIGFMAFGLSIIYSLKSKKS